MLFITGCQARPHAHIPPDGIAEDEAIAGVFLQINDIDLAHARLMIESGFSGEVMDIPRMIVNEHAPIRKRFLKLLDDLGIKATLPEAYAGFWGDGEYRVGFEQASTDELGGIYIQYEYEFSKRAVDLLAHRLIPNTQNKRLRAFLVEVLPQMKKHLMHIAMYRNAVGEAHAPEGMRHHP